jgi:hypothetical protein
MKFRVKELSLIGNELKQPGETIDGLPEGTLPAENLEPLDDEALAKYEEYLASNAERVKKMIEQNPASGVGDPAAFLKAMVEAQKGQTEAIATAVAEAVAATFARLFPDGIPAAPKAEEKSADGTAASKVEEKPAGGKKAEEKPAAGKASEKPLA